MLFVIYLSVIYGLVWRLVKFIGLDCILNTGTIVCLQTFINKFGSIERVRLPVSISSNDKVICHSLTYSNLILSWSWCVVFWKKLRSMREKFHFFQQWVSIAINIFRSEFRMLSYTLCWHIFNLWTNLFFRLITFYCWLGRNNCFLLHSNLEPKSIFLKNGKTTEWKMVQNWKTEAEVWFEISCFFFNFHFFFWKFLFLFLLLGK